MKKSNIRIVSALLSLALLFSGLSFNFSFAEEAKTVVINEVESSAPNKGNDWIELYNNSTSPVDISGWIISDDKGLERLGNGTTKAFPENTGIEAGGFLVFDVDAAPYNFGLGKSDAVNLYNDGQRKGAIPRRIEAHKGGSRGGHY